MMRWLEYIAGNQDTSFVEATIRLFSSSVNPDSHNFQKIAENAAFLSETYRFSYGKAVLPLLAASQARQTDLKAEKSAALRLKSRRLQTVFSVLFFILFLPGTQPS